MDRLLQDHLDDIRRVAKQHGATRVRVVGSRAGGEARPDSDLDLLVDLEKGRSLFDLIDIKLDLEEIVDCEVDVGQEFDPLLGDEPLRGAIEL